MLDSATGTNRYFSSPYPREVTSYASSTANDISAAAFEHVCERLAEGVPSYGERLAQLRERVLAAYVPGTDADVVFAASGTDLEYVALAAVAGRGVSGTHNILLGADEVGSGCIHSAHGRYFAGETARGIPTVAGAPIEGLSDVTLTDVPVREPDGTARDSAGIAELLDAEIAWACDEGRHALVHVVHGSKTGLILPGNRELAMLIRKWGSQASFVIDACQARIGRDAVRSYLELGCILFVTGSKFMGGPPFSGFAILPAGFSNSAHLLPSGLTNVFRRAEWPASWPGADVLADEENPGLALRLEASIFELERYRALPRETRSQVIAAFQFAVTDQLVEPLGLHRVMPFHPEEAQRGLIHPTAMQTLVTLDVGQLPGAETFADAQVLHKALVDHGIRLGQPVKCLVREDGSWGATLRIGLSMPQVVELAAAGPDAMQAKLKADMSKIANGLRAL